MASVKVPTATSAANFIVAVKEFQKPSEVRILV